MLLLSLYGCLPVVCYPTHLRFLWREHSRTPVSGKGPGRSQARDGQGQVPGPTHPISCFYGMNVVGRQLTERRRCLRMNIFRIWPDPYPIAPRDKITRKALASILLPTRYPLSASKTSKGWEWDFPSPASR